MSPVNNPVLVKVAQLFSTTVFDVDSNQAIDAVFIPGRSFADGVSLSDATSLVELLGGSVRTVVTPDLLPYVLTGLLTLEGADDPRASDLPGLAEDHPYAYDFAVTLTETVQIPVEKSPLSAETLAALAEASPVGAGVVLGVLAASANPWLVVILIPSGIILCSVAAGIGDGLRSASRRATEWLITGDDPSSEEPRVKGKPRKRR